MAGCYLTNRENLPFRGLYERLRAEGRLPFEAKGRIGRQERLVYSEAGADEGSHCLLGAFRPPELQGVQALFSAAKEIDGNRDGVIVRDEFIGYVEERKGEDPNFFDRDAADLARDLWRFSALYLEATTPRPVDATTPDAGPPDATGADAGADGITEVVGLPLRREPKPFPSSMPQFYAAMAAERWRLGLTLGFSLAVGAALLFAYFRWAPRFLVVADLGKGSLRKLFRLRAGKVKELIEQGLARRGPWWTNRVYVERKHARKAMAYVRPRQAEALRGVVEPSRPASRVTSTGSAQTRGSPRQATGGVSAESTPLPFPRPAGISRPVVIEAAGAPVEGAAAEGTVVMRLDDYPEAVREALRRVAEGRTRIETRPVVEALWVGERTVVTARRPFAMVADQWDPSQPVVLDFMADPRDIEAVAQLLKGQVEGVAGRLKAGEAIDVETLEAAKVAYRTLRDIAANLKRGGELAYLVDDLAWARELLLGLPKG